MSRSAIATPCIGVCAVNAALRRCIGCQRTVDEIAAWTRYSDEQRHAIMIDLERRRAAFDAAREAEE